MKLSVFYDHITQAVQQEGRKLSELLEACRSFGIEGVEINCTQLGEGGAELCREIKEAGLKISCVYEHYDFIHREELDRAKAHVDLAAEVGAQKVLIVPGFLEKAQADTLWDCCWKPERACGSAGEKTIESCRKQNRKADEAAEYIKMNYMAVAHWMENSEAICKIKETLRELVKHGRDILFGPPGWQDSRDFVDLDAWCRGAIQRGLDFHQVHGRGYLPEGLVEEIRALSQPPIPWDVELAQWFDERFEPLEKRRTYARLSRRQSATPDIPRPSYRYEEEAQAGRTFGVLLDTSGSMDRGLLAAALGAIASYGAARDVKRLRVVFCDAVPYDQGYMEAADIAGSVRVRGRGGTVLQPGVELLEQAKDFPREAPLLIITDCECDRLNLFGRDHAFLVPKGRSLPFPAKGPVFYLE